MSIGNAMLLGLLIVIGIYGVMLYNGLVSCKHAVAKAWANIDVLLKQRHDELPKLVEVCKQYKQFEQETLQRVIEARAAVHSAREAGNVGALGKAEGSLRSGLGRLFAIAEAYPELKTNEHFMQLQQRISSLEGSIADRRELYNETVNTAPAAIGLGNGESRINLRPNVEVRGNRSAKHGGNQQAQLVGCPTRLQG